MLLLFLVRPQLFREEVELPGDFLQIPLHLRDPGDHVLPVLAQELHPLPQRLVPLVGQFHKAGDLLQGHAGVLQAADQPQRLQVVLAVLPEAARAPLHPGDEALLLIIAQRVRREPGFFADVLNRIHQNFLPVMIDFESTLRIMMDYTGGSETCQPCLPS